MMENMRKRFKLTTKDDGSITPTFGLNDYTNKIARPNFWTQFLKGYKVEGMDQSPQCWKIYEAANEVGFKNINLYSKLLRCCTPKIGVLQTKKNH